METSGYPEIPEQEMDAADWAQVSVVAEISLRPTPAQEKDILRSMLDTHRVGTLTRTHAASSYGQPVILAADGQMLDYAAVESVHLLEVGTALAWRQRSQAEGYTGRLGLGVPEIVWRSMAESLAPFGIRVTRITP